MPGRRRSGKKIDFVHWSYGSGNVQALSAAAAAVNVFPALHEPETLLRLRGECICYIDGAQAPGVLSAQGVGLILVPEGTGTTVLWSPIVDGDAPWIWVWYPQLGYEEAVVDAVDVPAISGARMVIDNKAMRIIRNQEIQMVCENATVKSAVGVNTSMQVRALTGK